MSKYTLVTGDDWQGIYKDGKLIFEDNFIDAHAIAFLFDWDTKDMTEDGNAKVIETSNMPTDLKDI